MNQSVRSQSAATTPVPPDLRVMVGRQPILDRGRHVVGYELLFRPVNPLDGVEALADVASAHLITEGVLAVGLDKLTPDRRAFVEATPSFLRHELIRVLPANRVVIEVPADADLDEAT